jgi:TPR repeat protein
MGRAGWVGVIAAALMVLLPVAAQAKSRTVVAVNVFAAAERGDPRAQTQLGYMHERGLKVPQDYYLAAQWYHRAAAQGDPRAQHRLGILFNKGFGVNFDLIEAYKWLNLAATRVRPGERDYYARMRNAVASKLTYSELAEGQRRASFWRPMLER